MLGRMSAACWLSLVLATGGTLSGGSGDAGDADEARLLGHYAVRGGPGSAARIAAFFESIGMGGGLYGGAMAARALDSELAFPEAPGFAPDAIHGWYWIALPDRRVVQVAFCALDDEAAFERWARDSGRADAHVVHGFALRCADRAAMVAAMDARPGARLAQGGALAEMEVDVAAMRRSLGPRIDGDLKRLRALGELAKLQSPRGGSLVAAPLLLARLLLEVDRARCTVELGAGGVEVAGSIEPTAGSRLAEYLDGLDPLAGAPASAVPRGAFAVVETRGPQPKLMDLLEEAGAYASDEAERRACAVLRGRVAFALLDCDGTIGRCWSAPAERVDDLRALLGARGDGAGPWRCEETDDESWLAVDGGGARVVLGPSAEAVARGGLAPRLEPCAPGTQLRCLVDPAALARLLGRDGRGRSYDAPADLAPFALNARRSGAALEFEVDLPAASLAALVPSLGPP